MGAVWLQQGESRAEPWPMGEHHLESFSTQASPARLEGSKRRAEVQQCSEASQPTSNTFIRPCDCYTQVKVTAWTLCPLHGVGPPTGVSLDGKGREDAKTHRMGWREP